MTIPARFKDREDWKAAAFLAGNMLVVLSAGAIAWHIDAWWAYAVAFFLAGARGQACYILQHEAMHNLLFTSPKTNERVGTVLSAFLGTQFYLGRKIHWDHHRNVGQKDDPNESFHGVEARPPGMAIARFFLFNLFGGRLLQMVSNLWRAVLGNRFSKGGDFPARKFQIPHAKARIDLIALFGIQLLVLGVISVAASPIVYFAFFLLPLATLTSFFEAVRSFSEHVLPGVATTDAERNRSFLMNAGRVERFFISQFDFHLHHVHHLHPNVVTFKIRELHAWLLINDPAYKRTFIIRPGYVATAILYLTNKNFPGAGVGYPAISRNYRHSTV